MGDIKQFGSFQRAYLGVSIRDIDAEFAKDKNIFVHDGVYVISVEDIVKDVQTGAKFDERGIFMVAMYPNGKVSYYAIDLNE